MAKHEPVDQRADQIRATTGVSRAQATREAFRQLANEQAKK